MTDFPPSIRAPGIPGLRDSVLGAAYKKGDVIGQKYEVYGILGVGGFGIVYLVYCHQTKCVYALKTFRDEYLADTQTRERFRKEANVWADLERHPYLVRAYFVDEVAGRLFIAMEHVAPDEQGLNSMEGYLRQRPPDLGQSLRWTIQFCHGMEYANSRGIRCHRDIKPANIMIGLDKTLKITDFGLAGVLDSSSMVSGTRLSAKQGKVGLTSQTMEGTGFGTPTHMPPEQFTDAASCDQRSDIYSFGVVLYQMASGGRLPFLAPSPEAVGESESARLWREMHRMHAEAHVPKLSSPLFSIVQRCMEKEPDKRYQNFKELRGDLEPLLGHQTGETVRPPELKALEAWEWVSKGVSLSSLGRYEEAVCCYEKALKLDPRDTCAWNNKGASLHSLGRHEEATRCIDKALKIDPQDVTAWNNKGVDLGRLCRREEAIRCFDRALELDPRNALAWTNKGTSFYSLDRYEEAIRCSDKALELDPWFVAAWCNKGSSLQSLSRHEEAIRCYDKVLELDPRSAEAWYCAGSSLEALGRYEEAIRQYDRALELDPRCYAAWSSKGSCLEALGRYEEAIRWHDKVLELNPRNNAVWYIKGSILGRLGRHAEAVSCYDRALDIHPRYQVAWYNKGNSLSTLGRHEEAIRCFDIAVKLEPWDTAAWYNNGNSLSALGRHAEAIHSYEKVLEIDPRHAMAWYGKALAQCKLGQKQDAVRSFKQFIALGPTEYAEQVSCAQQRVRELEGG